MSPTTTCVLTVTTDADHRYGHWEIDTVIGRKQGQNPVLLMLTERQTNYTIVQRIAFPV